MFQTFDFAFAKCCAGIDNEGIEGNPKKIKFMKDVNNDELVLSS